MQKYRYSFTGCISIFLVGEVPNPLEDPYLAIRGCAFAPNALRYALCQKRRCEYHEFSQNLHLFRWRGYRFVRLYREYSQYQSASCPAESLAFGNHLSF